MIDDPFAAPSGPAVARSGGQRQAGDKVAPSGCFGGRGWEVAGTVLAGVGLAAVAVLGAAAMAVGACAMLTCAVAADSSYSRRTVVVV